MHNTDPFLIPILDPVRDRRLLVGTQENGEHFFEEEAGYGLVSLRLTSRLHRLHFLLWIVGIILAGLFTRLAILQLLDGKEYRAAAEENRLSIQAVPAPRGIIYDDHGQPLVKNVPGFTLFVIPSKIPKDAAEKDNFVQKLAEDISLPPQELEKKFSDAEMNFYQPLEITSLSYDDALRLKIDYAQRDDVRIETTTEREYPYGELFAHVLGYTGKMTQEEYQKRREDYALNDRIGKSGLEWTYEEFLRGEKGLKRVEVDVLENEQKIVAQSEPVPGDQLHLGLNEELQRTLFGALKEYVEKSEATGGSAVAMDPSTGLVRALVSVPSYDNNIFQKSINVAQYNELKNNPNKPLFNRAISAAYPPGSTFKPLVAAAALEEGIITEKTTVLSTGGIHVGPWTFPDWKAGGHGAVDVRKAIAHSVNTFFYIMAGGYQNQPGLGIDRLRQYAEGFGLNKRLGIDLPGEASGLFPTKEWKQKTIGESWYIGNTYQTGIGQGYLQLTPLQISTYTAAIANGGTLYQPHLLDYRTRATGENIPLETTILNQGMVSEKNLQVVREGMRQAALTASSSMLQTLPVPVAHKTGTAQFGNQGKTHSVFTSFAPYGNPEIVITVFVEGGGRSFDAAMPIAKQAYETWFAPNGPDQGSPSI